MSDPAPSKVAFLGAYDRFNYGDLLFPIVARNEFNTYSDRTPLSVHALVESNLSRFGALPSDSMRTLAQGKSLRPGDVVMFVGGGTIGVDWYYMHANLVGWWGNHFLYYLRRLFGTGFSEWYSRIYFGAQSPFPWVAEPDDFGGGVHIAYNAVGGSELGNQPPKVQTETLKRLRKATYISVRDAETKRLFAPLEVDMAVELAPDSAVLVSEQYPVSALEAMAAPQHKALLDMGSYLCFHCNLAYSRAHADKIVALIEGIYERFGLRAVLLPIGRYVGLDDQIGLAELKKKIRTPVHSVADDASIWEIMLTIARARLFIGTSLHGNITSQSYAVPHMGLSEKLCKVDHYLETWDLPEQACCYPIAEVPDHVAAVLGIAPAALQAKRDELIRCAHENFARMARACNLAWAGQGQIEAQAQQAQASSLRYA